MSNAMTRVVDGWSVTMDGDEPRILDEELGARLGFARPRDVRKLIESLAKHGKLNDIRMRAASSRIEIRRGVHREQVVNQYWLTEPQALKVIAKSETAIADQILDQVIAVFIAVRRGQLAAPQQVPVPVMPNSPTLGDKLYRPDVKARCAMTAKCTGASVHRVQGWLRKLFGVSGVYHINAAFYDQVCNYLEAWALGRVPLPWPVVRVLKAAPDPAQRVLPFPTPLRRPQP